MHSPSRVRTSLIRTLAPLAVLAAAASIPAQAEQQATTTARLRATNYAGASSSHAFTIDLPLFVEMQLTPEHGARLHAFGGVGGAAGAFLLGARANAAALPDGGTLLVEPALLLTGTFDPSGEMTVPVDLVRSELGGAAVFVQAVELADVGAGPAYQLSAGLELDFAPTMVEEPLPWNGPPLDVLLLHDLQAATPGEPFRLLVEATAPTEGYALHHATTETGSGTTRVFLDLQLPDTGAIVPMVVTKERVHVDLGAAPAPRLEILVRQLRDGVVVQDYVLVDVVQTEV